MSWQPKYILYGAILGIACLVMLSALGDYVRLAILLLLIAAVALVERRA
jgi:hypothetical protein